MTTTSNFFLDTGQSFNPTSFRHSFHNGIGRPALFAFRLKRYPKIYTAPLLSVGSVLGAILPKDLGIGIPTANLLTAGQTLYDSVTASGLTELQFRIDKLTIPDKNLGTYSTKIYGPASDFPRDIENSSITINVLCGGDYYEHDFFQTWIDSIMTYSGSKPNSSSSQLVSKLLEVVNIHTNDSFNNPYDVAYYDDIVTEAEIVMYDEEGNATYVLSFEDIFPKLVGGISLDWNAKNEISSFSVTLHYRIMTGSKVLATAKTGNVLGGILNASAPYTNLIL